MTASDAEPRPVWPARRRWPGNDDEASGRHAPHRLMALIDGVFAISMTLLALDVRIADDIPDTAAGYADAQGVLYRRLLIFIVAFLIAGRVWLANHRQLRLVHHVDHGLLERAVVFLAAVSSLPVATNVLFRFGDVPAAVTFASLVLALQALLSARMWWYLSAPARGLADVEPGERWTVMLHSLLTAVVFLLAIPVAFLSPNVSWAPFVWLLLLLVDPVVDRIARHRRVSSAGPPPVEHT